MPIQHLRRKAMALLAFLAVERQPHSRDALATLLWPDCGQSRARANLRRCLFAINEIAGKGAISCEQETLAFASGSIVTDVDLFLRLSAGCGRHDRGQTCSECLELLERAQLVYKNDLLFGFTLPDCSYFDQWQLMQGERLRAELSDVLMRLVRGYEARNRYSEAVAFALRLLSLDPLEETSHRNLMRLHAKNGHRAAALHQYDECRRILTEELCEEPADETEELMSTIRDGGSPGSASDPGGIEDATSHPRVWRDSAILVCDAQPLVEGELSQGIAARYDGRIVQSGCRNVRFLFDSVESALAAAIELQVTAPGVVRVVVHSGPVLADESQFAGPGIDHADAIFGASPVGEIILSSAAAEQARHALRPGVSMRPLGAHRFADLAYPEVVYQLLHEQHVCAMPELHDLDCRPNNLESQSGPLVGRLKELFQLIDIVGREEAPVVTLTGPAGTGKTRLALHVGALAIDRFEDGAFFIDLSPLVDPEEVLRSVSAVLGVRETVGPVRPLKELLEDYLRRRHILLILDNFEQVLPAAEQLAELLRAAPGLTLLVTSRQRLGLREEREYRVPPLGLPEPGAPAAALLACDSVRLFVSRGTAVRSDFEVNEAVLHAIARVCIRLDGLPLAIELAAAQSRVISPAQLADLMPDRLARLKSDIRDVPDRQSTLKQAIDWSYDLLTIRERTLFACLSVFVGGWTPAAAEAIWAGDTVDRDDDIIDGLASLADKSLLRISQQGYESRFSMYETVHDYARRRLGEDACAETIQRAHAEYFRSYAANGATNLHGPDQMEWLNRFEREYENFAAALRWFIAKGRVPDALELCIALEWFWYRLGRYSEARQWLLDSLEAAAHAKG
ncbi:MAG TPA: BTAD domain-containing putative transcriptional regulator, partial [Spirochaetia bacterium]|nr:BTAD domain-containing putative transcriptional regulator [Spirochaetia bacterium]